MKKFAMAAVAAAALSAGMAQAYTVGTFSNGLVVPNVIHNGPTDTTAVGLINQSGGPAAVYWTFFDQNSMHITDGCFAMTNKDYESFVWADPSKSGANLAGVRGYLVFAVGSDTAGGAVKAACSGTPHLAGSAAQLSANAFQVNVTGKDVAVVPVIDGPLTINAAATPDLTQMGPDSLTAVTGAAQVVGGAAGAKPTFSIRYFIDQAAGGTDTNVVVWSTGDQRGSHTVNIYDDKQDRKSVNFKLVKSELDWFDPEGILGLPATHKDGFIEWTAGASIPADYNGATGKDLFTAGGSVFTYSVMSSAAFGAVQTVLGAHR